MSNQPLQPPSHSDSGSSAGYPQHAHSIAGLNTLILRFDEKQVIQYVNRPMCTYLGLPRGALMLQSIEHLKRTLSPETWNQLFLKSRATETIEFTDDQGNVFELQRHEHHDLTDILLNDVSDRHRWKTYLQRYISTDLTELEDDDLRTFRFPEKRFMTVSFTDLRDFSILCQTLEPEELRNSINAYLDAVIQPIVNNGATVDKIVGDEVMALYGAPRYLQHHALIALNTACDQMQAHQNLRERAHAEGLQIPGCGIGINTGEMVVGNIGSLHRQDYTVLGPAVNLAARLCEIAEEDQILITESTLDEILEHLPQQWDFQITDHPIPSVEESASLANKNTGDQDQDLLAEQWRPKRILLGPNIQESPDHAHFVFDYLRLTRVQGLTNPIPVIEVQRIHEMNSDDDQTWKKQKNTQRDMRETGRIFGRYRLLELIGRGGMGEVWRARDGFGNVVAIKMLIAGQAASSSQLKRFRQEARIMARLDHRHICRIIEVGEIEATTYIAMEFIDGVTLSALIRHDTLSSSFSSSKQSSRSSDLKQMIAAARDKSHDPASPIPADDPSISNSFTQLPAPQALRIIIDICHALQFAHEHGVYHRDLKPANILLRSDGEPVVMDFGLAKLSIDDEARSLQSLSASEQILGTIQYMAPEQAMSAKNIDERADLYSLGAVLYQMMTGQRHFNPSSNILFDAQRLQEHTPIRPRSLNKTIDPDLEIIILKALRPDRDERYPHINAFREDLERYQRGDLIKAKDVSLRELMIKTIKRNRTISMITAMAVLGMLTLAITAFIAIEFQRQEAIDNALEAEKQANIASAHAEQAKANEIKAEQERLIAEKQRQRAEGLVTIARHNEGLSILERARILKNQGRTFEAKMLAAQTLGYPGLNTNIRPPALLQVQSPAWSEAEAILNYGPSARLLWHSPIRNQHQGPIIQLSISPDEQFLLSMGKDEKLHLWNLKDQSLLKTWKVDSLSIHDLIWLEKGFLAIHQRGLVERFSLDQQTPEALFSLVDGIAVSTVSPNRKVLLIQSLAGQWHRYNMKQREFSALVSTDALTCEPVWIDQEKLLIATDQQELKFLNMKDASLSQAWKPYLALTHSMNFDIQQNQVWLLNNQHHLMKFDLSGKEPQLLDRQIVFHSDHPFIDLEEERVWDIHQSNTLRKLGWGKEGKDELLQWGRPLTSIVKTKDQLILADNNGQILFHDMSKPLSQFGQLDHNAPIRQVVFSPDGEHFASLDHQARLVYRRLSDGKILWTTNLVNFHNTRFAFNADGSELCAIHDSHTVQMLDTKTGKQLRIGSAGCANVFPVSYSDPDHMLMVDGCFVYLLYTKSKPFHHNHSISSVRKAQKATLSADGHWLAITSDRGLWLQPTHEREKMTQLLALDEAMADMQFNHDSTQLYGINSDGHFNRWDLESGRLLFSSTMQTGGIKLAKISRDGRKAVLVLDQSEILIWDLINFKQVAMIQASTDMIETIDISMDGNTLMTAGQQGVVRIWDITFDQLFLRLALDQVDDMKLSWSKTGELEVRDNHGRRLIYNLDQARTLKIDRPFERVNGELVSLDEENYYLFAHNNGDIEFKKPGSSRVYLLKDHDYLVKQAYILRDLNRLITIDRKHLLFKDLRTLKMVRAVQLKNDQVDQLALSADQNYLAVLTTEGKILLYYTETGQLQQTMNAPQNAVSISISREGHVVCLLDQHGHYHIINTESDDNVQRFQAGADVKTIVFNPKEDQLLIAHADGDFMIHLYQNRHQRIMLNNNEGNINTVAFDPTGQYIFFAHQEHLSVWKNKLSFGLDLSQYVNLNDPHFLNTMQFKELSPVLNPSASPMRTAAPSSLQRLLSSNAQPVSEIIKSCLSKDMLIEAAHVISLHPGDDESRQMVLNRLTQQINTLKQSQEETPEITTQRRLLEYWMARLHTSAASVPSTQPAESTEIPASPLPSASNR